MSETFFVYGTLKRGFGNHSFLLNSEPLGEGLTVQKYLMTTSGIPFVIDEPSNPEVRQILGELYEVPDNDIAAIDSLEGHPNFYRRKKVGVYISDGAIKDCWVYFLNDGRYGGNGNYAYKRFVPFVGEAYEFVR